MGSVAVNTRLATFAARTLLLASAQATTTGHGARRGRLMSGFRHQPRTALAVLFNGNGVMDGGLAGWPGTHWCVQRDFTQDVQGRSGAEVLPVVQMLQGETDQGRNEQAGHGRMNGVRSIS